MIKLLKLNLRNFKGIREFTLDTNGGKSVSIYGDNATGKTTIFDAFLWLLFGKDSQNKSDFIIKTLDKNGNEIHYLNHEVEALLEVSGEELSLKKVFREKWQKKRGSAKEEFNGHTVDHFINEVPVKEKEYKEKISHLIDEALFKLMTSPTYFNEHLSWKERRRILLEICGDLSDQEVINSNSFLSGLQDILGKRSIEEHRKIVAAKMKEINKELERIPIRIDEVQRNMPDVSEIDPEMLNRQLSMLYGSIEKKQAELVRLQTGGEIAVKEKRLRELQTEMLEIKNRLQADKLEEISQINAKIAELKSQLSEITQKIEVRKYEVDRGKAILADYQAEINRLRQEFVQVNSQNLDFEEGEICPTCGQPMPIEKLEEAKAEFNRNKAVKLEEIKAKANEITEKGKELQAKLAKYVAEGKKFREAQVATEIKVMKLEEKAAKIKESLAADINDAEYIQKRTEEIGLKQEIAQLQASSAEAVAKVQAEINQLRQAIAKLEADKAKLEQVKHSNERIKELAELEQKLTAEYEQLEGQLFLTDEFIRTKVNLLEEKINSKFQIARFKLFEKQINGGINETCETLYDGVPYSNLNNAARINVGLDIINTLSKHYGFSAPIFIDNREAITKLLPTDNQVISLIVSAQDKVLRVEVKEDKKELKEAV